MEQVLANRLASGVSLDTAFGGLRETWNLSSQAPPRPIRHHFTVYEDGKELLCVSGWVAPGVPVYLEFEDRSLAKIAQPQPRRSVTTTRTHDGVEFRQPTQAQDGDLQDRLDNARALNTQDLLAMISAGANAQASASAMKEPSIFLPPTALENKDHLEAYASMLRRLDATSIRLGIRCDTLGQSFEATVRHTQSGSEGESTHRFEINEDESNTPRPVVSMTCVNGILTAIRTQYVRN